MVAPIAPGIKAGGNPDSTRNLDTSPRLTASDVDGFTNRLNNNLAKPGVKVWAQAYAIPTQAEAKAR
jgi:hypothetical protein